MQKRWESRSNPPYLHYNGGHPRVHFPGAVFINCLIPFVKTTQTNDLVFICVNQINIREKPSFRKMLFQKGGRGECWRQRTDDLIKGLLQVWDIPHFEEMLATGSSSERLQVRVIDLHPDAENINVWNRMTLNGLDKRVNARAKLLLIDWRLSRMVTNAFTQVSLSRVNAGLLIDFGVHVNQVLNFRHSGKRWTAHVINTWEHRKEWHGGLRRFFNEHKV